MLLNNKDIKREHNNKTIVEHVSFEKDKFICYILIFFFGFLVFWFFGFLVFENKNNIKQICYF